MEVTRIVLLTLLGVANIIVLMLMLWASKGKKDTASKIGFGFMGVTLVCNIALVVGGLLS